MRAYLVKDEATLEQLANQKFDQDLQNQQTLSKGAISAIEAHSSSFGSMFSRGGPQASILSQRGNSRGASSLRGRITGGNVLSAGGYGGIGGNSINQSSINNSDECNSMPNIAPGQTP